LRSANHRGPWGRKEVMSTCLPDPTISSVRRSCMITPCDQGARTILRRLTCRPGTTGLEVSGLLVVVARLEESRTLTWFEGVTDAAK
jgi:hypothetical protein